MRQQSSCFGGFLSVLHVHRLWHLTALTGEFLAARYRLWWGLVFDRL